MGKPTDALLLSIGFAFGLLACFAFAPRKATSLTGNGLRSCGLSEFLQWPEELRNPALLVASILQQLFDHGGTEALFNPFFHKLGDALVAPTTFAGCHGYAQRGAKVKQRRRQAILEPKQLLWKSEEKDLP